MAAFTDLTCWAARMLSLVFGERRHQQGSLASAGDRQATASTGLSAGSPDEGGLVTALIHPHLLTEHLLGDRLWVHGYFRKHRCLRSWSVHTRYK